MFKVLLQSPNKIPSSKKAWHKENPGGQPVSGISLDIAPDQRLFAATATGKLDAPVVVAHYEDGERQQVCAVSV
jgi:hypothetical protein